MRSPTITEHLQSCVPESRAKKFQVSTGCTNFANLFSGSKWPHLGFKMVLKLSASSGHFCWPTRPGLSYFFDQERGAMKPDELDSHALSQLKRADPDIALEALSQWETSGYPSLLKTSLLKTSLLKISPSLLTIDLYHL